MRQARGVLVMMAAYLACSGCAYDGAPTALYALAADGACEDLSCPFGVGTETSVLVSYDGQVDDVVITPPELATLTFDRGLRLLTVKPTLAGSGRLVVRAGGDEVMTRAIETAEISSTTCVPRAVYELWGGSVPIYPDGTDQLYASTMMRIVAVHRDANGRSLLGNGIEAWAIDGGSVRAEPTPPSADLRGDRALLDPALARDVIADGGSEISVAAGPQAAALVLRVVPPGGAATLALEGVGAGEDLHLDAGSELRPRLEVYDQDGRYVHGTPAGAAIEVEVSDPDVLTADPIEDRRSVFLRGGRAGTTTLSIRFDGREVRYTVRVR